MITKVIMPQMSLTMQYGTVSQWLKSPGDAVVSGEPICTIEGDKAIVDIESPATGVLLKIVAQEGEEFPVKQVMAYIGEHDDVIEIDSGRDEEIIENTESAPEQNSTETIERSSGRRVKASPVAKRLAKEKNIDLHKIKGSGPDGQISKDDVLAFSLEAQHSPDSGGGEDLSRDLSGVEKIIAERMAQSNREIPHFHLSISCNLNQANKLRKEFNQSKKGTQHISLTDILIWSVSRELVKHKILNSSFQESKIVTHAKINIGLAVNTPNGLIVVVIKDADQKSLIEISGEREELTEKAKIGKQEVKDLSEGTFTITNLGMFGIESFDPIITPGQVGILGVGVLKKTFELDEEEVIRSSEMLTITLGCDHRVVHGVAGAEFLSSLKNKLENPADLF